MLYYIMIIYDIDTKYDMNKTHAYIPFSISI